MDDFFVGLVDYWLVNLEDFFFVDDWLMVLMDNVLMLFMNNVFVVLVNDVLVMLMDNFFVMLLNNGLFHMCFNLSGEFVSLDLSGCGVCLINWFFIVSNDGSGFLKSSLDNWSILSHKG